MKEIKMKNEKNTEIKWMKEKNESQKKQKNKIKRKYKMIHDYPFKMSKFLSKIHNNGIIKCIYRKMRIYNNKKLNELIVNEFHYINVFNHTQPVLENVEPPKEVERICTIGIYDLKIN